MPPSSASISARHEGPGVNLTVWISLIVSSLAVLLKVTSKLLRNQRSVKFKNWRIDDYTIMAGVAVAVVYSIILSAQVSSGLGTPMASLDVGLLETYQKRGYATHLLYILVIALSQLSCLSFVLSLARDRPHEVVSWVAIGATVCWFIVSSFVIGFQCPGPETWGILSNQCVDQSRMWAGVEVTSILIDATLVAIPVYLLWDLQMSWDKKSIVIGGFGMRLIVVPLIVLRLVYIRKAQASSDRTLLEWRVAVMTTVILNVTLLVTCLPFLKPLMDQLRTGWYAGDVRTGFGSNSIIYRNKDYGMDFLSPVSSPTSVYAGAASSRVALRHDDPVGNAFSQRMAGAGVSPPTRPTAAEHRDDSRPSSADSQAVMIQPGRTRLVESAS